MSNGSLAPMKSRTDPVSAPMAPRPDRELLDRFHRLHDQEAFEQLVRRHGPMVLNVCRRILVHAHDAEDAFQATFLVLVRKAGSLRNPELLANYLYGVAYRVARKARTRIARQTQCERQAKSMPAEDVYFDLAWQELRFLLDQELQHLPTKYQAPLVLCYLEGLSNEEAARRLGWPTGSISYRLAKGRELLRQRLARRDKAFSAELLGVFLLAQVAAEQVPDELLRTTVGAAVELAVKGAGAPPALVGRSILQNLIKPAVTALLILVFFGLATSVVAHTILEGSRPAGVTVPSGTGTGAVQPAEGGTGGDAPVRSCH
jgi:RNA polymerase sigma factor (sigma-70 family)